MYYRQTNIKKSHKNNKFKIAAPRWYEKLELSDGSCSVSDIKNYFAYTIKKYDTLTDNSPKRIYVITIENKVIFRVKTGYCLELLTPQMMTSFASKKSKINEDENGKNGLSLEIAEVVSVHRPSSILVHSPMIINKIQDFCIHSS